VETTTDPLRDHDGEPLLFMDDIERMTGWQHETVKHYSTAGSRARREGSATEQHMPERAKQVRRRMTKGNGQPLVVWVSVWRQDAIKAWLKARGVLDESQR
jgi:hypothetical protein